MPVVSTKPQLWILNTFLQFLRFSPCTSPEYDPVNLCMYIPGKETKNPWSKIYEKTPVVDGKPGRRTPSRRPSAPVAW